MDPLQAAGTVVSERHPEARAVFLGGSVLTGHRTAMSDLDIVVLVDGPPAPYRESLHRGGWPVELFVHTEGSWHAYVEREVRNRRSPLLHMCGHGTLLLDVDGTGGRLAVEARERLAAGPPPVTRDEWEALRYALTDLLDDLEGCDNDDERMGIVMELARRTGELALLANGSWLGTGKWLARRLSTDVPGFAERLTAAVREALDGRGEGLQRLAGDTLGRVGGPFWAGYRQSGTAPMRGGKRCRVPEPGPGDRTGDVVLLLLDRLAEQGVNAFLRADPERMREDGRAWTFFAAGGPMPGPVRVDGRDPDDCLRKAVPLLRSAGLDVPV